MKNYSRQREAIANALQNTTEHPTASVVYETVKETIPNISLGTVYRNLAALAEEGKIKQLSVGDSSDHFDGDISPHSHFYCEKCRRVSDVSYVADGAYPELEKDYGFKVKASSLVLCGVCKDCNKD